MQVLSENLKSWGGLSGFITQWHICGPFEAGLEKNPSPNLFDKKHSSSWQTDHLKSIGGVEKIFDISNYDYQKIECDWKWEFVQPLYVPDLKLHDLNEYYPEWELKLKEVNTNQWSKLYYAMAIIESPEEIFVKLKFCGWDGCRLWVNGKFLFEEHSFHKSIYEKECVEFPLKKGLNQILFQLDRDGLVARVESLNKQDNINSLKALCLKPKPAKRTVSTFFQLHEYLNDIKVTNRFNSENKSSIKEWKVEMLAHYQKCLGSGPAHTSSYGQAKLVASSKKEKYLQEEYLIEVEAGGQMPCVILKPEKFNGISLVLLHGHVSNYRTLLGEVVPTGPRMWVGEYRGDYAKRMAEKGFMVITYCERGFSVRRDLFSGADACDKAQFMSGVMNMQLPRLHIADIHLVYDLLIKQKDVDINRVGISGLSGGGTLSYITAAFDERFKAVALFCCLCSYRDYAYGDGCGLQVVNGWFPKGDMAEILGLIAPRPLLIGQGQFDSTFNIVRVEETFNQVKQYYDASQSKNIKFAPYGLAHEYEENIAERFFVENLK